MSQINSFLRNVFVAFVGSRPLVVEIDDWVVGTLYDVAIDDDDVAVGDDDVAVTVF